MLSICTGYLALVGGAAAAVQVSRGLVRGVGRLVRGEPREALAEVAGGLVAPVVSVVHQMTQLAGEVCMIAGALTDDGQDDVQLRRAS